MDMSGKFSVNAGKEKVYSKLKDIEAMAGSFPGVSSMQKLPDGSIRMDVEVGMAFIKGKFNTEIGVEEKVPGKALRLFGKGRGSGSSMDFDAGFDLEGDSSSTEVSWSVKISIGGLAATIGSRMVERASQKYVDELVNSFKKACEGA